MPNRLVCCRDGFLALALSSSRTMRGHYAGYHLHLCGSWSGDYLVYGEESFRSAKAWHHVHLHRVRELTLPVERKFVFAAPRSGVLQESRHGGQPGADSKDVASDAGSDQEGAPTNDGIAKDYWVNRPAAVLTMCRGDTCAFHGTTGIAILLPSRSPALTLVRLRSFRQEASMPVLGRRPLAPRGWARGELPRPDRRPAPPETSKVCEELRRWPRRRRFGRRCGWRPRGGRLLAGRAELSHGVGRQRACGLAAAGHRRLR